MNPLTIFGLFAVTAMLVGSFDARYLTVAGIPEDWPARVLNVLWPEPG